MFLSVPRHNEVLWVCIGLNVETLQTIVILTQNYNRDTLRFGVKRSSLALLFLRLKVDLSN